MTSSAGWYLGMHKMDLMMHKVLRDELQNGLNGSAGNIDPKDFNKTQKWLDAISCNIERAEALLATEGLTDFSEFDRLMKDNIKLFDEGSGNEN